MSSEGFISEAKLEKYVKNVMPDLKEKRGEEAVLRYLKRGLEGDLPFD